MSANDAQAHIEALVAEEHALLEKADGVKLDDTERARLGEIDVQLDRYYDLLRQRRARAEFDQDEDRAHLRSADTVEKYLQ